MEETVSGRGPRALLLALIVWGASVSLDGGEALGASVGLVQPISFGNIIASPTGDTVEINARSGPATPAVVTFGNTIVSGGQSGLIRVVADMAGQTITFLYPATVTLSGGSDTMTLDGIAARSMEVQVSPGAGDVDFHMGGLLHIGVGQDGASYTGTITIDINVINP